MGLSVIEQIGINILTTLQNITTANGYPYQLTITRATFTNTMPEHLTGEIYQLPPDTVNDAPTQSEEWVQHYSVVIYILPNPGNGTTPADTTPIDTYNNECMAAIHKELQSDITRGGLALDTQCVAYVPMPPVAGEFGGFTYNFQVRYRTRLDDPYTPAN